MTHGKLWTLFNILSHTKHATLSELLVSCFQTG